jgi:hypothetical protein
MGSGNFNVHESEMKTMMELPCDLVQLQCDNLASWTEQKMQELRHEKP